MEILSSPQHYLFELKTTSPGEAKRLWRRKIKEEWDHKCAYCGSEQELTIDHVVPRSKVELISRRMQSVPVINVINPNHILRGKNGISLRSFLVLIGIIK